MRKVFSVILLILVILSVINTPVLAVNEDSDQEAAAHHTRDSLKSEINPEEAKSDDYLIEEWYCEIRDIGNDQVSLYGWTRCNRDCDTVGVELQLQRWNGSSWSTIGTYRWEAFDTDYNWGLRTVTVSPDYYYRVKSYHYANDGSIHDYTYAATGAIYID